MHVCPKINSDLSRSAVPGNYGHKNRQHYKYTMRLHVYVVRQNGTRKSNLDAFVAVQERSNGIQVRS